MKKIFYPGVLFFAFTSSVFANTVIQRHSGKISAVETVAKVKVSFPVIGANANRGGQFQDLKKVNATFTPEKSPLKILHDAPYHCTFKNVSSSAGETHRWEWYKSSWLSAAGSLCSRAKSVGANPVNIQGYIEWCSTGSNANSLYGLRMTKLSMEAEMECRGESPVNQVTRQSIGVKTHIPLSNTISSTSNYNLSYSYSDIVTNGTILNYTINEVTLTEQNIPALLLDAKFDNDSRNKSGYVSLSLVNRKNASDILHVSRQDTGELIPLDNTEVRFEDAIKLDVSTKTIGKHDIPLLVTLGID